ncbi:uncharacterized protein LOC122505408 [Leptopilina heterotoma]|uniref:uncharacterized protein LOC122505408 n=1 Tax=Leptopilina heterotoma TaxID=63436 RepID=UPI001CA92AEA|nr:uncharacterized protein LOC122505408 [Leptopilina heterotoma]XP_043472938.1 uncharacterized protein LOC122505408 [Leptopilina heterotoma]XP_043472939.1 uncharacterized protein LOC122505408 [Leptopilina heterotoma]
MKKTMWGQFWLMPHQFSKNKALHIRGPRGCQMRKMRCHWPSIHEARIVEQLERDGGELSLLQNFQISWRNISPHYIVTEFVICDLTQSHSVEEVEWISRWFEPCHRRMRFQRRDEMEGRGI